MKRKYGASLVAGLLLGCVAIISSAIAAPLPQGNCTDPKPYTDLRHCNFKRKDLSNKDLRGTDLRGINFHDAQLKGADLTDALLSGDQIMGAVLDNVKGLPPEGLAINKQYYLVISNANPNSPITLSPHEPVYGIQADIAGQANILMSKKTEDRLHTLAVLDWPRDAEGEMMSIVARFNDEKYDIPTCYRTVNLLKDKGYFWPHWDSMQVKSLDKGGYLIGVHAFSSDSDGELMEGWDMIAFLKLSPSCELSVLHKEDNGWTETMDGKRCQGDHLDYRFLDEQTAEMKMTAHTCGTSGKSKAKISYKKIKLNLHD